MNKITKLINLITDEKLTISDMVKIFNLLAQNTVNGKWTPVKKFSSKAIAIKRLTDIVADSSDTVYDEVVKMLKQMQLLSDAAETATEQVAETADTTTEQVAETADTATEQVAETADTATEQVAETTDTATEQVAETADTATEQVAETAAMGTHSTVPESAENATEQVAESAAMGTHSTPAESAKTAESAVQETPFQRRHRIHLERLERLATEKVNRKAQRDAYLANMRQQKETEKANRKAQREAYLADIRKQKETEKANREAEKANRKANRNYGNTDIPLNDNELIGLNPAYPDDTYFTGRLIDGRQCHVSTVELFYVRLMGNNHPITVKELIDATMTQFITVTGIVPDERWAVRNIREFMKRGKLVKVSA